MERRWLNDEEMEAWLAFIGTSGRLFATLDAELADRHGLRPGDYGILADLSSAPENRLRMTDLALARLVSKSGLTHHVNRLEADGLVRRRTCPTDRRGQFAELTAKGRRVLDRAAPDHVAGVRRHFFDHLDDEEVRVLARAFRRTEEHLRAAEGG